MKYLSVCSGIEAATVAWHPLGWKPVAFSEIEPFPSAVLKHHYPEVPNLGDMTKYAAWPLQPGDIDLLVGGTPCQSFSVAGLRKGLSDPRGGLMLTYLEIARRLRPQWIVWENVPGVLSSGSGRDFGSFLGALGELGYGWAYRVLDAQWVRTQRHPRAVPQRRRRVFVVGCLGDATAAAAVLLERESVCRDTAARGASRQGAADDAGGGARADGIWWDGSDCAATPTKQNANGAQRMPDKDNFGAVLTPFRAGSIGGYTQDEAAGTIRAAGGDLGGGSESLAVAFHPTQDPSAPMAMRESGQGYWMQDDIAGSLRANGEDRPSRPSHVIQQPSMIVRRLTPRECERLQAFPDDYTVIPWRGKSAADCPDGPRYKALGNSMAVNCMEWIGERIAAWEKRDDR